ncbi:MAG TPA: DUF5362 family protein [Chitinophagaceae bacterium]|nr:DUF5362 family protein [Chitinophagaceae bacterium]
MEQHDLLSNDLLISEISQSNLNTAAKWGKFLAIVGFVFCGLMLLGGLWAQVFLSKSRTYAYESEGLKYMWIGYAILAIICFFPCLYLFKFSNRTQAAIRTSSQENLDAAFMNLKSMFKFYGIFTIIILVIYALAFVFVMGTNLVN